MKNENVNRSLLIIVIAVMIFAGIITALFYITTQSTLAHLTTLNKAYEGLTGQYNYILSQLSMLQEENANLSKMYNASQTVLPLHSNTVFSGAFNIPAYTATLNGTLVPGSYNISFNSPSAGYLIFNLTLTPPPNTTGPSVFYIASRKYYLQLLGRWLFLTSAANSTGFSVFYQNGTERRIAMMYTAINQTPFYRIYPILNGTSKIEFFTLSSNGSTVSGTIKYYGQR